MNVKELKESGRIIFECISGSHAYGLSMVGYYFFRLEMNCEESRTSFRTVSPYNTSITCSDCKHADRTSRDGELFKCQSCGYTGNADVNAALNILERFVTGKYGSCYKPENTQELTTSRFL
ncbi:hypothetical protein D4R86_00855 [bacterium]|nr:MAG: hypothetical protein D4R86_00855 [bacterium]